MCIDLKNIKANQQPDSFRINAVLNTAGIVLVFVLLGWCLSLLPDALDQAFIRSDYQSYQMGLSGDHQYHPTTHEWTFVEGGK